MTTIKLYLFILLPYLAQAAYDQEELLKHQLDRASTRQEERNLCFQYAVINEEFYKANRLLAQGADINAGALLAGVISDWEGRVPVFIATTREEYFLRRAHYLLEHGADPNITTVAQRTTSRDINVTLKAGLTPLHFAVITDLDLLVFFLLKAGANHSLANKDGKTPLDYALQKEKHAVIGAMQNPTLLTALVDQEVYHSIQFPSGKEKRFEYWFEQIAQLCPSGSDSFS